MTDWPKLYPSLSVFGEKAVVLPSPSALTERQTWRTTGLMVIDLRSQCRGHNPVDRGQRRACTRLLAQINAKLEELGGERLDSGESWSEDDIDEGLKA